MVIPKNAQHSFFADEEGVSVVAYHPDSDCGPEHNNHPMLNRTYDKNVLTYPQAWEVITNQ